MVGTGRFELPTPRTPSECSTRLSHVPTRKEPAASHPQRMGFDRISLHQPGKIALGPSSAYRVAASKAGGTPALRNPQGPYLRLRFDLCVDAFGDGRRGASSRMASLIFFSTGSMRSTSTRILCPKL